MPSQRQRIFDLLQQIPSPAADRGHWGPEPGGYDLETARKIVRLGFYLLDLGQRERSRHFEEMRAAGKSWPRAELVQDDARLALHGGLQALDEMLTCPLERVTAVRERAHSCLEQAGIAIADPELRRGAGLDPTSRPRTRELLAARQADAEERKRVQADLGRALGRVSEAEQREAAARATAARAEDELRLLARGVQRLARGQAVLSFDRPGEEINFTL